MADYSNGFMAASYGIQGLADVGSAYAQSEALRAQGAFQRSMVEINNRFAAEHAKDAIKAGNKKASQIRKRAGQTIGAQRAAAAAQGIDVSSGTIVDQIYDTKTASEDEIITVKNNAWRESWGYKTQAALNLADAQMKEHGANVAANSTLLTGGMNAVGNITRAGAYGVKQWNDTSPGSKTGSVPTKSSFAYEYDDKIDGFSGSWFRSDFAKRKGGIL